MIDKLTAEQETMLKEYRDKVFGYATSTVTDKHKAETAAFTLTKELLINPAVHWAVTPEDACELYDSLRDSLIGSLSELLGNSLRDLLSGSLSGSLRNSLSDSLSELLRNSLRDLLSGSLSGSPWDSGFISYYRFPEIAGLVQYDEKVSVMLRCYEELLESCFAMYALPGHIILLEKPKLVKVDDGKLVGIEW